MNSNGNTEYFDAYSLPMEYKEWLSGLFDWTSTTRQAEYVDARSPTERTTGTIDQINPILMERIGWETVDLGFIQTLLKLWLINITDKVAVTLTILITVFISIFDTITDIAVAYTLFASGHRTWGTVVVIFDYISSWQLAIHNFFSSKWRNLRDKKEKIITIIFLTMSPFSMPLFYIRWLMKFGSGDLEVFNYLHHNARLSHLLNSCLQSPIQVIILLVLWGEGKLPLPWKPWITMDSQGRMLYLHTGIVSLVISCLSILKGSLELSEGRSWSEKVQTCAYAFCNFAFRLPSFALAIMYYNEWSAILFLMILYVNYTFIMRHDILKRKEIHIATSVLIMMLTPLVSSDQAHRYQRTDNNSPVTSNNRNRRNLSAKITMITLPIVFLSDLMLLLFLKYNPKFVYSNNIVLDKEVTETMLQMYLLPIGGITMMSTLMYRRSELKMSPVPTNYFGIDYIMNYIKIKIGAVFRCAMLLLALCGVCILAGITVSTMNIHILDRTRTENATKENNYTGFSEETNVSK